MPLPDLLGIPPGSNGVQEFLFWHAQDHLEIVKAIQSIRHVFLPVYILDQLSPATTQLWLERHQQAHNEMNSVMGTIGRDLTTVDLSDENARLAWVYVNFTEHQAVRKQLAI